MPTKHNGARKLQRLFLNQPSMKRHQFFSTRRRRRRRRDVRIGMIDPRGTGESLMQLINAVIAVPRALVAV
jgi:hypothetical protein